MADFPQTVPSDTTQIYSTPVPATSFDLLTAHKHTGIETPRIDFNDLLNQPGSGGPKTATFVIGPSSNSDSISYDYITDGTNDDVEIQAAIDALPSTGGSICFREGTYTLGSASVLIAKNGVTLYGMGKGTIITCKAAFDKIFFKLGNGATQYSNCVIRDIYFDGNKASSSLPDIAIIDNKTFTKPIINVEILHCYFSNIYGFAIFADINPINIFGNYFSNWDGNTSISYPTCVIYIGFSAGGSRIDNNTFFHSSTTSGAIYCDMGSTVVNNGFSLPNAYTGIVVKYVWVCANNSFLNAGGFGTGSVVIDHSYIAANNVIGNTGSGDAASIGIRNCNQVTGNEISDMGIGVQCLTSGVCVTGNLISLSQATGIVLTYGATVVTGNWVTGARDDTSSCIYINSADNIISGNFCPNTSGGGQNTKYGIFETSLAGNNIITNNRVTGTFTTGKIISTLGLSDISHNITL